MDFETNSTTEEDDPFKHYAYSAIALMIVTAMVLAGVRLFLYSQVL